MAKKKDRYIVYSDFEENEEFETLPPNQQTLQVCLEKKNRGGKTAVVIKGFIGTNDDLNELSKVLKNKCATGGSAKDGEIIIQGDVRDKVMQVLKDLHYNVKRVGG